jgi:peptide-methionine (S)-S-oxide reductase
MLPGVIRTRVGYTGGTTKSPSYYKIGDHTESFQVDFDPTKTSYEKILQVFWSTHNHCATPQSRQYMTAIFYHNEEQKKIAYETGKREFEKRKQPITSFILPINKFYLAESYHQKYLMKQVPLLARDMKMLYPKDADFLNSTAATRINGFVGGHGSQALLQEEIDGFGLTPQGRELLSRIVQQYGR